MNTWLNIALPKGRLGEQAMLLLNRTGYGIPALQENDRRLILENEERKIRYFWVKPIDVPVYVARSSRFRNCRQGCDFGTGLRGL